MRDRIRILTLVVFAAAPLAAQDVFTRITDLRPGTANGLLYLDAVVWNGALYFAGQDDASGLDLWRYDGLLPPALVAGSDGVKPQELVVHDGELFFRGGPANDRELWRYDGVAAPQEALDIFAGTHSGPAAITSFGDRLCFSGTTAAGAELMCWDGLNAPSVFDIRPGPEWSSPEGLAALQGELYFSAYEPTAGNEPRVYSGVGQPTVFDVVPGAGSSGPMEFTAVGVDVYFTAAADGQMRLFRREPSLQPVLIEPTLDVEGGLGSFAGALYVAGYSDTEPGPGLFRYEVGAADPLRGIQVPAPFADSFLEFEGALYFVAGVFPPFTDIYRHCDGSESVELVSRLFASDDQSVDPGLVAFAGRIYFTAVEELATGRELWALDPMQPVFCSGFPGGDTGEWSAVAP
jgi:ELWxxDGT repeat protein